MNVTKERNAGRSNCRTMRYLMACGVMAVVSGCATAPAGATAPAADPCSVGCGAAELIAEKEEMLEALIEDHERGFELPEFSCPHDPADVPKFSKVDDSRVPGFEPTRTRATNMYEGQQRLSDGTIFRHLEHATEQVFACIDVAACYTDDDVEAGDIEFSFEVAANGRVRGVDVTAPDQLADLGVVACARTAIYRTEFPAYDGGGTWVSFAIEID